MDEEHSTWFIKLPYLDLEINTTANVRIYQTPFMLMHRFEARPPIDLSASGNILSQEFAHKSLSWNASF